MAKIIRGYDFCNIEAFVEGCYFLCTNDYGIYVEGNIYKGVLDLNPNTTLPFYVFDADGEADWHTTDYFELIHRPITEDDLVDGMVFKGYNLSNKEYVLNIVDGTYLITGKQYDTTFCNYYTVERTLKALNSGFNLMHVPHGFVPLGVPEAKEVPTEPVHNMAWVLENIKAGEKYISRSGIEIECCDDGRSIFFDSCGSGLHFVYSDTEFTKVEKEKVTLITIEHKPNGKGYVFRLADKLNNSPIAVGNIVVKEDVQGRGYAKVLKVEVVEMTKEEKAEYREIIDIVD